MSWAKLAEAKMMFDDCYRGRRVLVTGHTGFKGSWLCAWLEQLGAVVSGYALSPITDPAHIDHLGLQMCSTIADLRDLKRLESVVANFRPEIIFHMAAQPSVLVSYDDAVGTFSTNVIGTVNLLEVVRQHPEVAAVIVVTTDKCYENKEWIYGYREEDQLGGHDPYSTSKACAEFVTACYRKCFFNVEDGTLVASVRAGNVIGGGDWTADRLIPDAVRAAGTHTGPFGIRNPNSSRPWQHVLEPLSGYLCLGVRLLKRQAKYADAWNFGPSIESNLTTAEVVEHAREEWNAIEYEFAERVGAPHEAGLLMVDSTKAYRLLNWRPVWSIGPTIEKTVRWYKEFYSEKGVLTWEQIREYEADARALEVAWAE